MYSATINVENGVQVARRRLFDDSEFSSTFVGFGSDLSYDVVASLLRVSAGAVRAG